MNTEMNLNELEQVNGGDFIDDVKDALKKLIPKPFAPEEPIIPPVIAHTK